MVKRRGGEVRGAGSEVVDRERGIRKCWMGKGLKIDVEEISRKGLKKE